MENKTQEQEVAQAKQTSVLHQVTPLSKYLAMGLFIILPFLGGYIGYSFAPEKVVERVVTKEVTVDEITNADASINATEDGGKNYTIDQSLNTQGEQILRFVNNDLGYSHTMQVDSNWLQIYEISQSVDNRLGGIEEREGTVLVEDLFKVSKIPYTEMSPTNMNFSYDSCCTGQAYYFAPDDSAVYVTEHSLHSVTQETIYTEPVRHCGDMYEFAGNVFANIKFADEGWQSNQFLLFTDQDYVLAFESVAEALSNQQTEMLLSLQLQDGVNSVDVRCE